MEKEVNMGDVKSLEHPTLKVPYEVLNKKFRTAQKNIDREVSHVQSSGNEFEKCLQKPTVSVGDVTQAIGNMVEKLTILKRKADESLQHEIDAARVIKRRVDHLKEVENIPAGAKPLWQKKRLDRMIVEFFLRKGYYNSALKLAKHSDIEDLTNIDLFLTSKEVEESLMMNDTSACLAWCHDNKSKLRKMKSCLEFNVHKQEFIELVRQNNRLEAVRHARKYFSNVDSSQIQDIQKVMGLLAFPADTQILPYKELFDPGRWHTLVLQFREENFKLHQLNTTSVFTAALHAGLSSLKTPYCYKRERDGKPTDCPVCSKHLNEIAKPLPYAHCANSRLICAISGCSLNEHNPPMILPNGYVYGFSALAMMASENDGRVVCPKTKQIFHLDDAQKVFVM